MRSTDPACSMPRHAEKIHVQQFLQVPLPGAPAVLTPAATAAQRFCGAHDFGNQKGGAGFVLLIARAGRPHRALGYAAVPGGDVAWAKPLVGAVAAVHALRFAGRAKACAARWLAGDADFLAFIQGAREETDFAATYLTVLRFGYVHNPHRVICS